MKYKLKEDININMNGLNFIMPCIEKWKSMKTEYGKKLIESYFKYNFILINSKFDKVINRINDNDIELKKDFKNLKNLFNKEFSEGKGFT
jgi:hypothetical protein